MPLDDWGSVLGFDWANQHRDRVQGIAFMEAIVTPISWSEFPADFRGVFEGFRSPQGEMMVLEQNIFVEQVLPAGTQRQLRDEEMDHYRQPFANSGESRRPTLSWPRNIPIDGEPADVASVVDDYSSWLAESDVPKLFVNAEPGVTGPIVRTAFRDACAAHGIPAATLTDNDMVFTTRMSGGKADATDSKTNFAGPGISQINSTPNHPTTCGKVERFHQTLKKWLTRQPRATTITELVHIANIPAPQYLSN